MKKIKKFFIYNIILSFILVGSLYSLSWIYVNYVNEKTVKFLELDNNKSIQNLKVINLGTSHAFYDILYPKNIKGYNLGLHSQSFYYDYQILEKHIDKLDQNGIVIIPISIQSFYNGRNFIENYIPILDKEDIPEVEIKKYILGKYFSITQPMTRLGKIAAYFFKIIKNKKIEKNYIDYPDNLTGKELENTARISSLEHIGVTDKRYAQNKEIGIKNLENILILCEQKRVIPIFITFPHIKLSNDIIGKKNYQERIYDNIKEVEKRINKKYLYLDYSYDKRFENNLEYFFDADHLNQKGAEYFTEILLNDIKSHGYNF